MKMLQYDEVNYSKDGYIEVFYFGNPTNCMLELPDTMIEYKYQAQINIHSTHFPRLMIVGFKEDRERSSYLNSRHTIHEETIVCYDSE